MRSQNLDKYFLGRIIAPAVVLLWLLSPAFADYRPGQIIVRFKPGVVALPKGLAVSSIKAVSVTAASVRALNAKYEVSALKQLYSEALRVRPDWTFLENNYILTFPKDRDLDEAIKDYRKDPNVVSAAADSLVRAFDVKPNDPLYSQQWGLTKIEANRGWLITTGTSEIIVAVLDTGLNYDHEDLAAKADLADAQNFVARKFDGTPYSSTEVKDDYGHGSAVSGVIAAVTNNLLGVAGLDWNAKILPLKVLDDRGMGDMSNVSAALAYAASLKSKGKKIVAANMSLGQNNVFTTDMYVEQDQSQIKENCILAYNQGIVLVAAAGNDGKDYNTYPAYYKPYVVAVAATDRNDNRSVWNSSQSSNYASWVDVSAPGTDIYAPEIERIDALGNVNPNWGVIKYSSWNGTSLATPFVAGLASLVKAANPMLTNAQIVNQIKTFTDKIDALNPGYAGKLGTGRINAFRALAGLQADVASPANGAYLRGKVPIIGTAAGWNFSSYEVDALKNGSLEAMIAPSAVSVNSGTLATWDTTAGRYGPYIIRLLAYGTDGSTAEADVSVIVDNITPEAAITSPVAGANVQGIVAITGRAANNYLDHYVIEYGAGTNPTSYQNLGTFYSSVESGTLATWETAGLSGSYTLRLTAYDKAGNVSTEAINVAILSEAPTKQAQAVGTLPLTFALPNPFVRSGTGATAETQFSYSLAGNFLTTIYLFDVNGNLIWQKSYAAGENGGKAGANNPAWNGYNLFGSPVADGVYLYQITADKKVIGRGKVIVLN